jgi:hypothetical protein
MQITNSIVKSWLKHTKETQLIEENFVLSKNWLYDNNKDIENIIDYFRDKYSQSSMIATFYENSVDIFATNLHENRLYFAITDANDFADIYKKMEHILLVSILMFHKKDSKVFITIPKINKALKSTIEKFVLDLATYIKSIGMKFEFYCYLNDSFYTNVISPLIKQADKAGESEEFLQSLKLINSYNLASDTSAIESENRSVVEESIDLSKDIGIIDKEFFINNFERFKQYINGKLDVEPLKHDTNDGQSIDRFAIIERIFRYELEISVLDFILTYSPEFDRKKPDLLLKAKKLIQKYG